LSPRAILFDALGTLIELEPPAPRLKTELAERYGVRVSDAEAIRAIGAEISYYRGHLDEGKDEASLAALRERCAAELRRALPTAGQRLPPAADLVDALLASLRFHAYPDASPALAACRARGLRLVVVSNWDVSLHERLRELDLAPMLDAVLTSAEAGARKPAPAIFELALRLAGVTAADALHVGDSIEEDVAGARAAGIEPVFVSRDGTPRVEGVRTVSSLAQLVSGL
jgi:putative hydrolase of the HAD superfamily